MHGCQLNRSYFVDTDFRYGWGNISHFTYLSEFNRKWRGMANIEAVIMTVLFVLSTAGNVFILGFIYKTGRSVTITNYFVANLALADTLFVCSAPFLAYVRITENWLLGPGMCNILCYEMLLCGYVMLWTMAFISIDRYICINLPTAKRMSRTHARFACVGIWVVSVILFIPLSVFFNIKTVETELGTVTFCNLLWQKASLKLSLLFIMFLFLTGLGLPLAVIATNYFRILKKFWKSKRAVEQSVSNSSGNSESALSRRRRNMQVVKTLIIIVVLFVVMLVPVFLCLALVQHDIAHGNNSISASVLVWAVVVAYLNSCINPFLYGVINVDIQRYCCLFCCTSQIASVQLSVISNAEM